MTTTSQPIGTRPPIDRLTEFAGLFAAQWYCQFPCQTAPAQNSRAMWTGHLATTVGASADGLGWSTHPEAENRFDAVLRDDRHVVAVLEWEWDKLHEQWGLNEYQKLQDYCLQHVADIQFACLVGYAVDDRSTGRLSRDTDSGSRRIDQYAKDWLAPAPLLLIVIHFQWRPPRRVFTRMTFQKIVAGEIALVHEQPAYPWT